MKFVKYSLIVAGIASLSSCLKSNSDFGGTRTDVGTIVTSIAEKQYLNTDAQNVGYGFSGNWANFNFAAPATESVRFFTLHISQPRDTKLSGNMTVHVTTSDDPGYTALPAGVITVSDITVPASDASGFDVPVFFTVNKAGLDPTEAYGVHFTITSVSQGVYSELDKDILVIINGGTGSHNASNVTGRYIATTTITDSAGLFAIHNNTRPYILTEGKWNPFGLGGGGDADQPGVIYATDLDIYGFGSTTAYRLYAFHKQSGTSTGIYAVAYKIDANGKVIDVLDRTTGASLNPIFDASSPNAFTYTSNASRRLDVKYTIRVTPQGVASILGANTTQTNAFIAQANIAQPFTITDSYVYDPVQVSF